MVGFCSSSSRSSALPRSHGHPQLVCEVRKKEEKKQEFKWRTSSREAVSMPTMRIHRRVENTRHLCESVRVSMKAYASRRRKIT